MRALAAAAAVATALFALDRACPPDLSRYRAVALEVRDAGGETLNVGLALGGVRRLLTSRGEVDPGYVAALLRAEDGRFAWHPGVDPFALARAAYQYAAAGRIVSGGSTIAMQSARLLMPHRRDVAGKLLEMARAAQLWARYGRDGVLEMYLMLAPFGGNLEGVRAASLAYFGHEPNKLSPSEIALLVALPQSPARLRPDRHPEAAAHARDRVAARLGLVANETVPVARMPMPGLAPHLAQRLRGEGFAGPIATTLDEQTQRAAEAMVARETPWLGDRAAVAMLIVRNRDRAVTAYVGGERAQFVDLVRARRSPGSALKPFIYGMAFDDAVVRPQTLLEDAGLRIGDYAPRNFDRELHGTVTVREALQQSYNLPAVALLDAVGPGRFLAALRHAGARLALPPGAPGLPVALGGLGVSLEDLASLYCALADGGRAGPLRLRASDPRGATAPLMTAQAAGEVDDILRGAPRPDGVGPPGRPIAYKTGTSYGFRDALAVGFSPRYTVAVWVGRVDGTPRPGAFGRATAAPLMFRAFALLPDEPDATPPGVPSGPVAPALRRFAAEATGPRILFPPADAMVEAGATPVALEAAGGTPPYRWAVDGVPLAPAGPGMNATWQPAGAGFARVSVIDGRQGVASETVRVVGEDLAR